MDDRFEIARKRLGDVAERAIVNPLHQLHTEVDRLIHDYAPRVRVTAPWRGSIGDKHPIAVDVLLHEDALEVVADVPGMDIEDIETILSNGALIIRGARKQTKIAEGDEFLRQERDCGGFYRAIEIPFALDETGIKAALKNGVLTVKLPKAPEGSLRQRTIAVRAE